jgi:hypothetical protein
MLQRGAAQVSPFDEFDRRLKPTKKFKQGQGNGAELAAGTG